MIYYTILPWIIMPFWTATTTPVDECTDGTHDCHAQAACIDTADSFTCTCNAGYTGDGTTCTGKALIAQLS